MTRTACLALLGILLSACGDGASTFGAPGEGPQELADLSIVVNPPENEFEPPAFALLSDGRGSYWHDAVVAARDEQRSASGLFLRGEKVLSGWRWWVEADSSFLDSEDLNQGLVRPDFVVRTYVERDTSGLFRSLFARLQGQSPATLTERIAVLATSGNDAGVALSIEVPDSLGTVSFLPELDVQGGVRVLDHSLVFQSSSGRWLAFSADGARASDGSGGGLNGLSITFTTPGIVVVSAADSAEVALRAAEAALATVGDRRRARSMQLVERLNASPFRTEDASFNKAFRWVLLTLDALVVRDSVQASLALGLPGLEADAGPGVARLIPAFLMSGAWADARGLLISLARAQRFDRRIDLLGRAPNAAPPFDEPLFKTADATPLFLSAAGDVVRVTGNRGLVTGSSDLWFKTVFALRGLYEPDERRGDPVSGRGFLLAREGFGTWADPPPDARTGGASPRYGAPVEGQPALLGALRTAQFFAEIMGVGGRATTWYADTARVLKERFLDRFVLSGNRLADRLDLNGEAIDIVSPSAAAALALLDSLGLERKARMARTIAEELGLPHGIATLPQSAEAFHPYLEEDGIYTVQESLFSGDVWTWLSGPMVTTMAQTGGEEAAYALTMADAALILDRGTVGGIPERLAGHPRRQAPEPAMGGAPVQPFSLAGFLQSIYEGYLGVRYASGSEIVLEPHLPDSWGETEVSMRLGAARIALRLNEHSDGLDAVILRTGTLPEGARVRLISQGRSVRVPLVSDSVSVAITEEGVRIGGEAVASSSVEPAPAAVWDGFSWPEVELRDEYSVLQVPESQRSLAPATILRENPGAEVILTQTDPSGDDWGATSTFTYPAGFSSGVLDGTFLQVARDDSTTYFRIELAAPVEGSGHPFLVVALNTREGGEREVGYGSDYQLAEDRAYEYLVLLGDGLSVLDAQGREVAGIAPGSEALNPNTGVAAFALPEFLLPPLEPGAQVSVLVGARDASQGIGSFRAVLEGTAGEQGGGRVNKSSANVYDVIRGRVRR